MKREVLRPAAAGAAIGVISGLLGFRWSDALLTGLVAGVLVAVFLFVGMGDPFGWPEAPRDETSGARREVWALTWSFIGSDGRVSEAAVRRLRSDASRRLAQRGIVIPGGLGATTATSPDIDDDVRTKAREALGERAWAIMTAPGGTMPSLWEVAHCIDVVEGLVPKPEARPPTAGASGRGGVQGAAAGPGARRLGRAVRAFRPASRPGGVQRSGGAQPGGGIQPDGGARRGEGAERPDGAQLDGRAQRSTDPFGPTNPLRPTDRGEA
jgi:hypothetical protein